MSKQKALARIEEVELSLSKYLDLSNLGLLKIPSEIQKLKNLEILNLSDNQLTSIDNIHLLPNLNLIDFRNNNLSEIGLELIHLGIPIKWKFDYRNHGMYFENNPISNVPLEIIKQGNTVISSYLHAVSKSKSINEIKVVLIGDGGVGKTSIVNRFTDVVFDHRQVVTHGISIRDYFIEGKDRPTKIKFWDFGGQEIMHSTHQIFFTKRTIYLLVVDSRRENRIEYWLKSLNNRVGQVPVIIITNKIDQNTSYAINELFLNQKYSNIRSFCRISCLTNEGFENLINLLKKEIHESKDTNIDLPDSWYRIKEELEHSNYDYISYQYFQELCQNYGINESNSQNSLSEFLNDLGVIIHFKNLSLYNTQILNPGWITRAIYKIINSQQIQIANGRFNMKDVKSVLGSDSQSYPANKLNFIVGVMREFELLFQLGEDLFVIPDLLPINEPSIEFEIENSIKLSFEYQFLYNDLFPKILVRLHSYIKQNAFWRTGVILNYQKAKAVIRVDKEEKRISVWAVGIDRKELFLIIRNTIRKVNSLFPFQQLRELIPLLDSHVEIEYADLIGHKEAGHKTFFSGVLKKEFKIDNLLQEIESKSEDKISPIQAFISYSNKDHIYKNELVNHLSSLVRIEKLVIWEDGEIAPGQIWEQEIMNHLEEATLVLCLISSDFIASEFCYSIELQNALKGHYLKKKVVVPIQLRECVWNILPIGELQGIPKTPIASSKNPDEAWTEVVESIHKSLLMIKPNN